LIEEVGGGQHFFGRDLVGEVQVPHASGIIPVAISNPGMSLPSFGTGV
jgi:hypothetical protein